MLERLLVPPFAVFWALVGCADPIVGSWELHEDNEDEHLALDEDWQQFDASLEISRALVGEFSWLAGDEIEPHGETFDVLAVAASGEGDYTLDLGEDRRMTCAFDEELLGCDYADHPRYLFVRDVSSHAPPSIRLAWATTR